MSRRLTSDAKPRRQSAARFERTRTVAPGGDGVVRVRRRAVRVRATRVPDDGVVLINDYSGSGNRSGLVVGVVGPQGGMSKDPAGVIASILRGAFRPRQIAPVTVTGPNGEVLRTITFGPNGEQTVTHANGAPTTTSAAVPAGRAPGGRHAFNGRLRKSERAPMPDHD